MLKSSGRLKWLNVMAIQYHLHNRCCTEASESLSGRSDPGFISLLVFENRLGRLVKSPWSS